MIEMLQIDKRLELNSEWILCTEIMNIYNYIIKRTCLFFIKNKSEICVFWGCLKNRLSSKLIKSYSREA